MSWAYFARLLATIWSGHKFPVLIAPLSVFGTVLFVANQTLFRSTHLHFWISAFLATLALFLILVTNWLLFRHLITISGRRDVPIEVPAAIARSALLLFALINLYAALYVAELGPAAAACKAARFLLCGGLEMVRWFYFSSVTFSTLGYGDISPGANIPAELTASGEALNGLVAFGVFTGALTTYLARDATQDSNH